MRSLLLMCWLHGHEHPWSITVKLERVSVERCVCSLLRNGKACEDVSVSRVSASKVSSTGKGVKN